MYIYLYVSIQLLPLTASRPETGGSRCIESCLLVNSIIKRDKKTKNNKKHEKRKKKNIHKIPHIGFPCGHLTTYHSMSVCGGEIPCVMVSHGMVQVTTTKKKTAAVVRV